MRWRGPHFRRACNLGRARPGAWGGARGPHRPREGASGLARARAHQRGGGPGHERRPQKRPAQPPDPAPSTQAPASGSQRPRPARGPALRPGHRSLSMPPPPGADPSAGLAGGAGGENKGAAPASSPAAAPPAAPTALASPAARAHRRIVLAALALPPAQNDEPCRPARARPAGHFRGHATSARDERAAESACARALASARRRHLVGTASWARPAWTVRRWGRLRGPIPLGLLRPLPQAFFGPGHPQGSARKLKGRGSVTVSLSPTRNVGAAWHFREVLERASVNGRVSHGHASFCGYAAVILRGQTGPACPL